MRSGARLVRSTLPEWVHVVPPEISSRYAPASNPEQELTTLEHELAHWLPHRARGEPNLTVFEYEAEAVESLVIARLV